MYAEQESRLTAALMEALPMLAKLTGGCAVLSREDGRIIYALGCGGHPAPEAVGRTEWTCTCEPQMLRIPLGPLVLALGSPRTGRDAALQESIARALPVIARVAGGIAVTFDQDGRRLRAFKPDGTELTDQIGYQSSADRAVMETQRPVIGPSNMAPGAMAIRIPITPEFGLGFNNAMTVQPEPGETARAQLSSSRARYSLEDIVGESPALAAARQLGMAAAAGEVSLCIYGETGTGKELFAQALHNASRRRSRPFLAVNCAALPESLAESMLFGYVGGSFTGADREGRPGLFEQASGGTLLLDEVSEMGLTLQAKLLRVLQEREVLRIGASRPRPVDLWIICTTNRDLSGLVRAGQFRADLLYRLEVLSVHLPPLRERTGDLPLLVRHLLPQVAAAQGKSVDRLHPAAEKALLRYDWPGNIRELRNCLEHAVALCEGATVMPGHLPPALRALQTGRSATKRGSSAGGLRGSMRSAEREMVAQALARAGGSRAVAARSLGISTTTLWRKLKRLGME